ncbi:hypothetical protein O3P69_019354 [Scylla paramamosain]|uniref:Angiotensin-converting enzyme n=1 Tax=Scylla paramamosain TaxID=85552 RepID=A0AAW0SVK3_SCYPA
MLFVVAVAVVAVVVSCGEVDWGAEEEAVKLLNDYHKEAAQVLHNYIKVSWDYNTNITDYNNERQKEASSRTRRFNDKWSKRSRDFVDLDLTSDTRRMMRKAFQMELNEEDGKNLSQILSNMSTIYSTAQVCLQGQQCMELDPELTNIMANSRNYSQLVEVWEGWRKNVSRKIKPYYLQYLELMNEKAKLNDFSDAGQMWRNEYETEGFEEAMEELYREIRPLYNLVHAYVRKRLREHYQIDPRGALPACVLGDIWGRIKMCTQVTMDDLQVAHHELGHVQYFMQYAHLPLTYRDGANGGFHEAIGELVGAVMETPQHLNKVGLLPHPPSGPGHEGPLHTCDLHGSEEAGRVLA